MTAQDLLQPPNKYRLRVADYLTLAEAGAFRGLQTELVEGDVIVMSPEFRPHWYIKSELSHRLWLALKEIDSDLFVGDEGSVALSDHDMPRPDIIVTSAPKGEGAIPVASIALLVEVSDSTLKTDLSVKAAAYAREGVPEYWVVDVNGRAIHQMWSPGPKGYAERREVAFGERIEAAMIEGLVAVTAGL